MSEIVNGAGINNVNAHVSKSRSKFPLKEEFLDTHRFGEYHPHFVLDGISSSKLPFRCIHDARSYTLKAPLMQDISMHKDYFMVTLRSILPNQAERVVTNPNLGDDVPSDAYTSVSDFVSKVGSFATSFDAAITTAADGSISQSELIIKKLIFLESVFSRGSLLASLGCNLSTCFWFSITSAGGVSGVDSIDDAIDDLGKRLNNFLANVSYFNVTIDGNQYYVENRSSNHVRSRYFTYISVRDFLQRIRDTSDWSLDGVSSGTFPDLSVYRKVAYNYETQSELPIDISRLWAYHLVCAEYFTNDKVDYIYSAELFRQYYNSLFSSLFAPAAFGSLSVFSWNGVKLSYDYLSSHWFNSVINLNYSTRTASERIPLLQYFLTLFGYHRSLRFKDYFTGSRTRPLAITSPNASTDVNVNSNKVSVIDVTRSIQVQRFLNAVNAAGRKYGEYIDALFGVRPNKDMHEPIFLAHSSDNIFTSETENTGDAQFTNPSGFSGLDTKSNSVTAVFRGKGNEFEYSVDVTEPCIIIGVTSYDIERSYPNSIQRSFFTRDRFDMFIPEMQYIGDQPVYRHELFAGSPYSFGTPFGYQFNGMHWKQMYNRCAGAFGTKMLPGYAFVFKNDDDYWPNISPDFIRSRNSELDEFYLNLSAYSLGHYFHFILKQVNITDASLPMIAQPQIL